MGRIRTNGEIDLNQGFHDSIGMGTTLTNSERETADNFDRRLREHRSDLERWRRTLETDIEVRPRTAGGLKEKMLLRRSRSKE
jgi:hypothetical protein